MSWESEIETNTQWAVKKLSYTQEPSFCLAALMLSSILPHTRSCKASREGGAFSGLVCLDRKCAWSASSNDFEVQYLSVSGV